MTDDAWSRGNNVDDARSGPSTSVAGDSPTPTQNDLAIVDVFEVLGDSRRRYLMYAIGGSEEDRSLQDITTDLVAWETNKPRSDVTDTERNPAQIELYFHHLPKLAALGALDYHLEDEAIVTKGQNTDAICSALGTIGDECDARQKAHASGTGPK
ncbi:DUF7344 domain-containing protein [Halomarina rubra]|uniref:DUF7344 domain-containing protein n=1 Tax=Halomarina rubra TaxID=2071873 RepID=A0ABD6AY01_9EURY|nr:hypothetical protein [Halomarina rubra]